MSDNTVVTENTVTNIVEVTSAGPAGPPGGALTIQDEGVDEGLLTDKINFAGSTVSVNNDTINEIATITVNAADPGANANITSLTGVTGGISSPDFIQFDTAAGATGAVGKLLWNDTDGTLEFQLKGGNVTLQIGQEQVVRVTNTYGSTISDGQAVYITGSTGNHLNVTLAQANSEATSSKTLAVITESIANNSTGFATTSGLVRGLNTSALTEGAAIWLSPTVAGGLTSTKPVAPNHAVLIGWCVRQSATVGSIFVHIANGYELDELHDVLITAAANNQVLRYDSATGLWKNATISPTVTLAGAVTGSGTLTDLGSVTITTTATSDPTLTLTGDASGTATFTNLGDATLAVTVADNSHDHTIANVTGLQAALDLKAPLASPTFTGTATLPSTTSIGTVSATEIGYLDGVTSGIQSQIDTKLAAASYTAADVLDKIKTVDGAGSGLDADLLDGQSSAYYTAINDRLGYTAENAANKGIAGGYASLDGAGLVPATQLPSYVDDVVEYASLAVFPATGETSKIYVALDTNKVYRWGGSSYVEISPSPGSTDAVPEGATNLYHTTARARGAVSAGTGISYNNTTGVITNSAPDQTVSITGAGTTAVTGTYPNFTVTSADQYVGTVTSVALSGGTTGLTVSGSPITSSGTITLGGTLNVANGGTGATSLTSGYLVKGNGTAAASASVVYDDGTNVGIGTVPSYKLDVSATGNISGQFKTSGSINALFLADAGTTAGTLYIGTVGNDFRVVAGSNEAMRVTSAGNLGIGTTNPGWKLEVVSASTDKLRLYNTTGNGNTIDFLDQSWQSQIVGSAGNLLFNAGGTSEKMRLDNVGNLGIGTSSPGAKLHVLGSEVRLQSTGGFYSFYDTAGTTRVGYIQNATGNLSVVNEQAGYVNFYTNNTERMRLDASGNLGLGGTPSGASLPTLESQYGIFSGRSEANVTSNAYYGAGWRYTTTDAATQYRQGSGTHAWYNAPSGTAGAAISFTQSMTLDASGNLGVGTTSPGAKLHIADAGAVTNLRITNSNASGFGSLEFHDGTGARGQIWAGNASYSSYGGAGSINYSANSGSHVWFTNYTERARIDSSGNLLVGTTSAGLVNSHNYNYTVGSGRGYYNHVTGTGSGADYLIFGYGATQIGSISQNGTTGVLYNTSSDARLKENIADADSASSLIDQIKVRKYDWKSDGSHQRYGFIAQELLPVAPEAVSQPEDPEQMMGVDYSKLVPMLVKELQSVRARLAELEGKL